MKRLLVLPFLILFTLSTAYASEYVIDPAHSHVGFSVKHLMISTVKGEFKSFDADLDFDAKTKSFHKMDAKIEAKSVNTGIVKRDAHLRSADFFDIQKFPEITFKATKFAKNSVTGNLTIKGVTKEITLKQNIHGVIKFRGESRVGFSLEGEINRKDFGLNWNKALEAGGVLVGDKVKIVIDIEAIEL
jgi:polyisoprenoid-binding protein YceI